MRYPSKSAPLTCVHCHYDLAGLCPSTACPECGTSIARSARLCPRCESINREPRLLNPTSLEGVLSCNLCRGIGFEPGALKSAIEQENRPAPRQSIHDLLHQSEVRCARCIKPMTAIVIDSQTIIDRCVPCGFVWMDSTEFMAVVGMVRRTAGRDAIPNELDTLLDDPSELARMADKSREPSLLFDLLTTARPTLLNISFEIAKQIFARN